MVSQVVVKLNGMYIWQQYSSAFCSWCWSAAQKVPYHSTILEGPFPWLQHPVHFVPAYHLKVGSSGCSEDISCSFTVVADWVRSRKRPQWPHWLPSYSLWMWVGQFKSPLCELWGSNDIEIRLRSLPGGNPKNEPNPWEPWKDGRWTHKDAHCAVFGS